MRQGLCQALDIHLELTYDPSLQGAFNAVGKTDKELGG